MNACLLTLLSYWKDTVPVAHLSLPLIFEDTTMETSPADLSRQLRRYRHRVWSEELETGWDLFQEVLDRAQRASDFLYDASAEPWDIELGCSDCNSFNVLSIDNALSALWAAIHTYRRINTEDPVGLGAFRHEGGFVQS
ncbi:hypothetical protein MPH_03263 [Macrophomina phaseolina MS6]|uniref:Uncharacterized protein n=1 Tax=Macrophomina phaseolina (strain MS6) TaxID=1126212 RepID=K2SRT3_MACPH|nr:hypothetical protein MPH_03263 [Macrophomina phaseolina MS6]